MNILIGTSISYWNFYKLLKLLEPTKGPTGFDYTFTKVF
jgi:hypothetical protein